MGNIVLLDDLTINKIAAGEVIERPASVVKEMVENSIDAGATKITVEIKNGGISFIRVSDNGKGIKDDDMEIAFERHATSKIRTADDILKITSMGFRGEALASIAAIAHVEMISRTEDSAMGYKIVVEGGKTLEKTVAGSSVGTTITVTNLFFNTPVRYKFLKKDFTESGYIEDAITRLALVNKNIAFKFINNGKTIIQTNGDGDSKNVIYSVFGKDVAEAILDVDYELDGIKITGVVGKPEISRSNRNGQLFFVNSRYIKDKTLSAAADQAFKGMIPINKYGFLVLNIHINPELVDVNVHPAKLEVRFEEESKVFKAVYHAIKSGLAKGELVENVLKTDSDNKTMLNDTNIQNSENIKQEASDIKFEKNEIEKKEHKSFENTIKHGFKGLFSRKHDHEKEDENEFDDKSEGENKENLLEEIYKFRNGLKELGISEVTPMTSYDINKIIEEDIKKQKENPESSEMRVEENYDEKNDVPSDQVVSEMTEKLLKDRSLMENGDTNYYSSEDSKEIENKQENSENDNDENNKAVLGVESNNNNNNKNEDKEEIEIKQEDFSDMYKKIFGESIAKIDEETAERELTEDERKVLEDIKQKAFGKEKEESEKEPTPKLDIREIVIDKDSNEQLPEFRDLNDNNYRIVGIVFSTYIIIEFSGEMYIIDQHAAHERIMYEKVKKNYYSDTDKDSQLMLMPDVISLSHKEAELVKENLEMFEKAGFTLEAFGENTIKLTGVPNICMDLNTKQLFLDLLDEINTFSRTALQEKEDRFIATIACKAAVKANMRLTDSEVKKLMDELLKLPNPFTCPHGRPTAIKYTKYDLERKFSRK